MIDVQNSPEAALVEFQPALRIVAMVLFGFDREAKWR
jgi:hypothetical protein